MRALGVTLGVLLCAWACSSGGEGEGPPASQDGPDGGSADGAATDADAGSDATELDVATDATDAMDATDATGATDAPDAGGGCASPETLLDLSSQTYTPSAVEPSRSYAVAKKGIAYCRLRIRLDLHSADLLPVVTDAGMTRLEHIFFGLSRANQTKSNRRYLMGTAAVRFTNKQSTFKMYGRVSFGDGLPQGQVYTSYTSWQASHPWKTNADYHVDCSFDAVAKQQSCTLSQAGAVQETLTGKIDYIDVADMASAFQLELGSPPAGPELTAPMGWTFSKVMVTGERSLP